MINYKATLSHSEIAEKMGLTRSKVISIERTALRKIRTEMIQRGYISPDEINPSNNTLINSKKIQEKLQNIKKTS